MSDRRQEIGDGWRSNKADIIRTLAAIALAALTVAILDGLEAILYCRIFLHVTASGLFQYIASAAIGFQAATTIGWPAVVLGIALHAWVALCAATVYVLLSRRFSSLVSRPLVWGPVYGIAVYLVMHCLVAPLTRVPHSSHALWRQELANQLLAHVFAVGLPIALIVHRFGARREAASAIR
jgi:uncharacterized membrane protein YagU involved in acid resistance